MKANVWMIVLNASLQTKMKRNANAVTMIVKPAMDPMQTTAYHAGIRHEYCTTDAVVSPAPGTLTGTRLSVEVTCAKRISSRSNVETGRQKLLLLTFSLRLDWNLTYNEMF